jgi:hypothetical protein
MEKMDMDVPRGLHERRLDPKQNNPREIAFVEQWEQQHQYSDLLGHLFVIQCDKDDEGAERNWGSIMGFTEYLKHPLGDPTERDRIVAATVIQWLGSNIGMGLVEEALKKAGYGLKYPERPPNPLRSYIDTAP